MVKTNERIEDRMFNIITYTLLAIGGIVMIIPLLNVFSTSISHAVAVDSGEVSLFPVDFTLASWSRIISTVKIWQSFGVSVITTIATVIFSLLLTALTAYPLAKKEFKLAKIISIMVVITMIFKAPMIPYFIAIKSIGLYDNILVLIIPHLLVAYNLIIMRTFFKQIPDEMEEAAKMEGCGYFRILFQIVLPISKPVLATLGLFYAVTSWNQFLHPILFIQSEKIFPLQLRIRAFIVGGDSLIDAITNNSSSPYSPSTMKATTVIFAVVPIIMVYPFIQKYFVKGAMLGSVKG